MRTEDSTILRLEVELCQTMVKRVGRMMNGDSQTDTRNEPLVHPTEGNLMLLAGILEPCMYPPRKAH